MYSDVIQKLSNNLTDKLDQLSKIYSAQIDKGDFNQALNILKNIDIITHQLKELDFQTMTSKYKTTYDGSGAEVTEIAIWKQNGFGQIKDHEKYRVETPMACNSCEIKNKWYDVLKFFIETKQSQLIQLDYTSQDNSMKHRGTGKTTALLRLSNDLNVPILVKDYGREHNELERLSKELGLHIIVVDLKMLNMLQFRKYDVLLVDEGTNFDFINDVLRGQENKLNSKILIGFKSKS